MEIEDLKNEVVAFASVDSSGKPHNIAVEINDLVGNKVIITNNEMRKTIDNIEKNPNVSLVFWDGDDGLRIDGKAEYFDSGKWFDFVKDLPENEDFIPKGVVVVNITAVKEL